MGGVRSFRALVGHSEDFSFYSVKWGSWRFLSWRITCSVSPYTRIDRPVRSAENGLKWGSPARDDGGLDEGGSNRGGKT